MLTQDATTDPQMERRQVALPGNPNCVAYAADAVEVLSGRHWCDVLQLAGRIVEPFHKECGLTTLAGFGWRVALDRKNHRRVQATMWFQFDGPASAAHLDTLDSSVDASGMVWSQGNIERVPVSGVPGLLASDGILRQVLRRRDDRLWIPRLLVREHKVVPAPVALDEACPRDLTDRPQVIGLPAPYGDRERHGERMRLAFARHFSQAIIEADGEVADDELEFMRSVFPDGLMRRLELDTPERQAEYLQAAREELPRTLGHHDKLGLVGLFFSACYSDGSLDAREMRVLKEAGELLGLSREQVVKYLRRFW